MNTTGHSQGTTADDGTIVRGQVLAGETGRPLPRARVVVTSFEQELRTTTDSAGSYEMSLPPGRYWIRAERQGYLTAYYDQREPQDAARSIVIESGKILASVDISLRRYGAIAGRVLDDLGEPVENAGVMAAAADLQIGRTNDIGEFRIPRLPPGEYIVWAIPPSAGLTMNDTTFGVTYAPGTLDPSAAARVEVPTDATSSIDISLIPGKPANVSGRVASANGNPASGANVSLNVEHSGRSVGWRSEIISTSTEDDGSFVLPRVPPGNYRLSATVGRERGDIDLNVGFEPVDGVFVTTRPGTTLVGQLTIQNLGGASCRNPSIRVGRVDSSDREQREGFGAPTDAAGSFELADLYGLQRLSVRCGAGGRTALVQGISVDGSPVDGDIIDTTRLGPRAQVHVRAAVGIGVVRGKVIDPERRPCECVVLIVHDDAATWSAPYDYVWEAPAWGGVFELSGLAPGEYFALVEPARRTPGRREPEYLRIAQTRGTPFRISGTSETVLDLQCP